MIKFFRRSMILGSLVFLSACSSGLSLNVPWARPLNPTETLHLPSEVNLPSDGTQISSNTVTPAPDILHEECNFARADIPFDISIADGTVMKPGDSFTKTWRLVNVGSCTWTSEYSIVWFFGDDMGVSRVKHLRQEVSPGESVDISVDMFVPEKPGIYHSYWKLRNPNGEMFGIGPQGDAPFWVSIEVLDTTTPTLNHTPLATPTIVIQSSGESTLSVNESLNVDDIDTSDEKDGDLVLLEDEDGIFEIETQNGAMLSLFSSRVPSLADCQVSAYDTERVYLQDLSANVYFCYVTSQGSMGFGKISSINLAEQYIILNYQTWKTP